jgi:hypothetical protein
VIGQVGRSCLSMAIVTGRGPVWLIPEYISFLGWWPFLISQEWEGYMVQDVWFSSHLPLEGTDRVQIYGS